MNAWYANYFMNFAPQGADAPWNDPKFWIVLLVIIIAAIIWGFVSEKL